MLLLLEAQERLDGTKPGHKAADVAQWISEILSDGCWVEEIKRMASLPHSRLIEIDEAMALDWRAHYAAKTNTYRGHVFYWWELIKTLQDQARGMFEPGIAMRDYVYILSEGVRQSQPSQQILGRTVRNGNDDTEEIPF